MTISIQERFEQFHRDHPEVYSFLLDKARRAISQGHSHFGIGALWEIARWYFQFENDPNELFKLNNNFRSRYARKLMAENPELAGFFETRVLKAA